MVPDGGAGRRRAGLPVLVRLEGGLAVDADSGPDRPAAAAFQQTVQDHPDCSSLAGWAGGFFWRYSAFFQKGATSVGARFDYWQAALQTAKDKPLFGTGPGTFAIAYEKIKRPESEMARLVHNDYLEQASDSGVVGLFWSIPCSSLALGLELPAKHRPGADRLPAGGDA